MAHRHRVVDIIVSWGNELLSFTRFSHKTKHGFELRLSRRNALKIGKNGYPLLTALCRIQREAI